MVQGVGRGRLGDDDSHAVLSGASHGDGAAGVHPHVRQRRYGGEDVTTLCVLVMFCTRSVSIYAI